MLASFFLVFRINLLTHLQLSRRKQRELQQSKTTWGFVVKGVRISAARYCLKFLDRVPCRHKTWISWSGNFKVESIGQFQNSYCCFTFVLVVFVKAFAEVKRTSFKGLSTGRPPELRLCQSLHVGFKPQIFFSVLAVGFTTIKPCIEAIFHDTCSKFLWHVWNNHIWTGSVGASPLLKNTSNLHLAPLFPVTLGFPTQKKRKTSSSKRAPLRLSKTSLTTRFPILLFVVASVLQTRQTETGADRVPNSFWGLFIISLGIAYFPGFH